MTPAKKPRTECCCQPVTFIMALIVVPLGCASRARTASCLVPGRVAPEPPPARFALPAPLGFASFRLVEMLRCDIWDPFGYDGIIYRHHRSPAVAAWPAGRDPRRTRQSAKRDRH